MIELKQSEQKYIVPYQDTHVIGTLIKIYGLPFEASCSNRIMFCEMTKRFFLVPVDELKPYTGVKGTPYESKSSKEVEAASVQEIPDNSHPDAEARREMLFASNQELMA